MRRSIIRQPLPAPGETARSHLGRKGSVLLAIAVAGVPLLTACGAQSDAEAGDDCGYAFVFEQPTSNSTAQQTIRRGLEQAEADLGVNVDIVDGTGLPAVADNLRAVADDGCYVAIGTAFFSVGDTLTQVARDYPTQKFFILSGVADGENVYNYTPANEQGTYVAGAMAAAMSETHTLGTVLGDSSPPLLRFSAGFRAGARSSDPNIEVLQAAVGSFSDAAKAGAIASSQRSRGADVIYSAAGANLEVYFQARTKGYQVVASDLSDYESAKSRDPAVAFVAAEAADQEAQVALQQFHDGTAKPGTNELGLEDGVFSIPYVTDQGTEDYTLPPGVVEAGKKAYAAVVDGTVDVPTS